MADSVEETTKETTETTDSVVESPRGQYKLDWNDPESVEAAVYVCDGWKKITVDLTYALGALDPDFNLLQVREKFAQLRYECQSTSACTDKEAFLALITAAVLESERTCIICGNPGLTCQILRGGWWYTLCQTHAARWLAKDRDKESREERKPTEVTWHFPHIEGNYDSHVQLVKTWDGFRTKWWPQGNPPVVIRDFTEEVAARTYYKELLTSTED